MSLELETVHSDMLAAISDRYQKTAGFPAYDLTRAFALAVLSLDNDITIAEEHLNVDNLTGIDLDEFIRQHRGLSRKYATFAEATLRVVSGGGGILAGDLFATASGVEFYAISDGTYAVGDTFTVRASVAGEGGNVAAGAITYMPVTIAGIGAVTNDEAASGGYDEESDDDFRSRYYTDLQTPNNGSNQQAYIAWATSVAGVGRAKVFPQALGANTVEVCVIDANMESAGESVIEAVQDLIDPNKNGDGSGEAPIGAVCTVTTAAALAVNVSAELTLAEGYSLAAVTETVKAAITAYLRGVAFVQSYASYAQIGQCIATADGVLDYAGLKVNGAVANLAIGDRQTPVLGTVTLT